VKCEPVSNLTKSQHLKIIILWVFGDLGQINFVSFQLSVEKKAHEKHSTTFGTNYNSHWLSQHEVKNLNHHEN